MKRIVVSTKDGSSSIYLPEWDEHYHSHHGAIQEARHVFIKNGLKLFQDIEQIDLLEVGFGTGLNAFLTVFEAGKNQLIRYQGLEAFPVTLNEIGKLNYAAQIRVASGKEIFQKMHASPWGSYQEITPNFFLNKTQIMFEDYAELNKFDLVYFDAFGARVQPELWTETIFEKMYGTLKPGGVLVTYAAKGSVRRAMLSVGFSVEKLPGPPGKREMLRAKKI